MAENESTGSVEETYESLQPLLRYVVCAKYRIPPTDAENIIQEIFLDLLIHRERIQDRKKWLIGAACNSSKHYWRIQSRSSSDTEREEAIDPKAVERQFILLHDLRRVLAKLDDRCRGVLKCHYVQGYSLAELAVTLSTSTEYVKTMLHRCRQHARTAYERLEGIGQ